MGVRVTLRNLGGCARTRLGANVAYSSPSDGFGLVASSQAQSARGTALRTLSPSMGSSRPRLGERLSSTSRPTLGDALMFPAPPLPVDFWARGDCKPSHSAVQGPADVRMLHDLARQTVCALRCWLGLTLQGAARVARKQRVQSAQVRVRGRDGAGESGSEGRGAKLASMPAVAAGGN